MWHPKLNAYLMKMKKKKKKNIFNYNFTITNQGSKKKKEKKNRGRENFDDRWNFRISQPWPRWFIPDAPLLSPAFNIVLEYLQGRKSVRNSRKRKTLTFPAAPWLFSARLAIFSMVSTLSTLWDMFSAPIKVVVVLEPYFTLLVGLLIKMRNTNKRWRSVW